MTRNFTLLLCFTGVLGVGYLFNREPAYRQAGWPYAVDARPNDPAAPPATLPQEDHKEVSPAPAENAGDDIIETPDLPQPQSYIPASIKDFKTADPAEGISLIKEPVANSQGNASMTFAMNLPDGRAGIQPGLSIQYSSDAGPSWLGNGWNMSIPAVTIETRWGVPRYDAGFETEMYELNGQQLTNNNARTSLVARVTDRRFYPRVEGDFDRIIRHGSSPSNYWWEVTEKNGTRSCYGGTLATGLSDSAVLKDDSGHVAYWALMETRDLNDNFIRYSYTTVMDPGVDGSTMLGRQLYLSQVFYTGSGSTDGLYKIEFTRDRQLGDTLRKDVTIDARLGLKTVSADLLRKVTVSYNNTAVRSYDFQYTEGAFYKTLLKSISELDDSGAVFYTHRFDYYDDVNKQQYTPVDSIAGWNVPGDGVKGDIKNPIPDFTGESTVLGSSKAQSTSGGVGVTVGSITGGTWSKKASVGGFFNYGEDDQEGMTALIDINGDGLPDKVFKLGDSLYFRPNLGAAHGFGDRKSMIGITQFSTSTTINIGGGVQVVPYVGFLGYEHSEANTTTNVYFSDFNGDGLMDIAADRVVYFNHLNADGIPVFTATSSPTPNPIATGKIDSSFLVKDTALQRRQEQSFPLQDIVRMWQAPFDGTVTVTAPVQLVQNPSESPVVAAKEDGVRASIQLGGTVLWNTIINAGDYTVKTPSGISNLTVAKGQQLYFRLQSRYNGQDDRVNWDPAIQYSTPQVPTSDHKVSSYYKASDDFILHSESPAGMGKDGVVLIDGTFTKNLTTDTITVLVTQVRNSISTVVYQRDFAAAELASGALPIAQLSVLAGDEFFFSLVSRSYIDRSALQWAPHYAYVSFADGTAANSVNGNPILEAYPVPDNSNYNVRLFAVQPFIPAQQDTVVLWPQVAGSGMSGTLWFTVKGNDTIYARRQILVNGGVMNPGMDSIRLIRRANEPLYMEYATDTMSFAASLQQPTVQVFRDSIVFNAGVPADSLIMDTVLPANLYANPGQEFLGPLFRGWGAFSLKGDKGDGPIDTTSLNLNELSSSPSDPSNYQDSASLATLQNPSQTNFVVLFPNSQKQAWVGYDSSVYVTGSAISSSRLGMHDVSVDSIPADGSSTAVDRKTHTVYDNFAGGVFLGPAGASAGTSLGTTTTSVDMIDMNGDLYPDIVNGQGIQYTLPNGALNQPLIPLSIGETTDKGQATGGGLGSDFIRAQTKNTPTSGAVGAENTAKHSIGISGGVEVDNDEAVSSWMDINGDGLPDRIYNDGTVSLNLGYRFAPAEQWGLEAIDKGSSLSEGAGLGLDLDGGSIEAGVGLARTTAGNSFGLVDVNGDGLPDQLSVQNGNLLTGPYIQVRLNTGKGFGPGIPWSGFSGITVNTSTGEALNAAFTAVIPIPIIFLKICINPSVNTGHGVARQQDMVMDIDGDGFADMLHSTNDDNLTASVSTINRTNLLRTVKGPLGSSITLDYARTGNTYAMPFSKLVLKSVTVYDGVRGDGVDTARHQFSYSGGYQDRKEREFYGFSQVVTSDLNTANQDKLYRSHVQQYLNDSYYDKGLVASEWLEDSAGKKYWQVNNLYDLRVVQSDAQFPALTQTQKQFYEGQAAAGVSTVIQYDYDTLGNVTKIGDAGDGSQQDMSLTAVTYHNEIAESYYLKNVPASVVVTTAAGEKRKSTTTVNSTGDITSISQYLADGTVAKTDIVYDNYGNVTTVTRPANYRGQRMVYMYEYDDVVHSYTTKITDSFGYVTTNTYDYRFGIVTGSVNRNDEQSKYTLDSHGRILAFTGPYELAAGKSHTIAMSYHADTASAYAVTSHYDPEYDADISVVNFVDGLDRSIQVKKQIALFKGKNVADDVVMSVSGKVLFDAFGRAEKVFYPTTEAIGASTLIYDTVQGNIDSTTSYDVRDRAVKTVLADGATTTHAYNMSGGMFDMTNTDALKNHVESLVDVRSRTRSVKENGPEGVITTRYDYDALNELVKMTDSKGNVFSTTYDNLGRKLSAQHPDGGLISYVYDPCGNLVRKVTAEIRKEIPDSGAIQYQYDFDRLTDIDYPRYYQNKVKYIYGEAGSGSKAGRVTLQLDASGGQEYFYGLQGAVKKEIRTILLSPVLASTYVSEQQFDTWGRVKQIIYPDGEAVNYHYNKAGGLLSMDGEKQGSAYGYVDQLGYDRFGQRVYMRYGNGTENLYKYDSLRRRLAQLQAFTPAGLPIVNNSYRYDPESNLLGIVNDVTAGSGGLSGYAQQDYHYDNLYRLDSASGQYQGTGGATTYGVKVAYDDLYNIVHKSMHGAAGGASYDWLYTYGGAPHQATGIGGNKYTYDANGNQLGSGNTENYYDEENRVIAVVNTGVLSQYTYDADDELVIRSSGGMQGVWVNGAPAGTVKHTDNWTAYVSPYIVCKSATFVKHYYIEGQRIASKLGHGNFINISFPQSGLSAGNVDYVRRAALIEQARNSYYSSLGVSPGPPTDKNYFAEPQNSGIPAPVYVDSSAADTVPAGWPGNSATPPNGPPVYLTTRPSNDSVKAGYGFQDAGQLYETDQFFFHPDHLGSTTYVSDAQGGVMQHVEYSPFGQTFVEEHVGSFVTPYLFNAKERDDQTGYYLYGARNYNPALSQWLDVLDPAGDLYPEMDGSGYGLVDETEDGDAGNNIYMYAGASPGKTLNPSDNVGSGRGKENKSKAAKNQARKATYITSRQQVLRSMHLRKKAFRIHNAHPRMQALRDEHNKAFRRPPKGAARRARVNQNRMAARQRRGAISQGGNGAKN